MGAQSLRTRRARRSPPARRTAASSISIPYRRHDPFVTLEDNSVVLWAASELFDLKDSRNASEAARLSEQLVKQNRHIFSIAQIQCDREFDGRDVFLRVKTGNTIGAIPLISPTTGKPEYGVIVKPRFPWSGIGTMLAQMGWRIAPTPLKLDVFRGSEKSIPRWVLSSMILLRIHALLKTLTRRFDVITEYLNAPRGYVRWTEYATQSLPTANFLSIPCTFPELRQDRFLLGTIRYCLERIIEDLQSQVEHGPFVHHLIELAHQLLPAVRGCPVYLPTAIQIEKWLRKPLQSPSYFEGLQSLQWTIEKRGLAGSTKLEGIPWVMEMERFFEAWVETVFHSIARTTGGTMKVGRLRQTTKPIAWDPPYIGSQKSLIPDLCIQWGDTTLILDAKYKRHFEELQFQNWWEIESVWKEQHRNDLLQVLAYANLADSRTIISCLVYPCTSDTWLRLKEAGKLFHKAEISIGQRVLYLWLTASPMTATVDQVASPFVQELIPLIRRGAS
jgi:hypothetical protein